MKHHLASWRPAHVPVSLGSSTITRVVVDDPTPEFKPRPVGFTADLSETEPQLWEGDGA